MSHLGAIRSSSIIATCYTPYPSNCIRAWGLQPMISATVAIFPPPQLGFKLLVKSLEFGVRLPRRRVSMRDRRHGTAVRGVVGFTFLEIIITIVLLGLVYVISLPAIARARVSAAVHNSRHVVVSSVFLARGTAMRLGRLAVLRLDSGGDRLWIEADTSVAGGVVDTIGFYSFAADLGTDLQSNRSTLCFNGRGIGTTSAACPQAGARIVVSLAGQADTVLVTAVGRVIE